MAASPIPMRAEPQPMRPEPFDKFRTWAATFDPGLVYEMASASGRNVAAVHPPGFVASSDVVWDYCWEGSRKDPPG
jgi:hypothetical protein